MAAVLEEYERCTTAHRHGRSDPPEPGEAALPANKRRVLQYPGVVAWYCALKLELYASYVLAYGDIFGVYEWGSGGIVHMHLLGWFFPGRGRYDCHEGEVPARQRREDAKAMAWQHGAEISEWNLGRQDHWETSKDGFDEDLTAMNACGEYGPVPLTDNSDSDHEGAGREEHEQPEPAIIAGMQDLRSLLENPDWHPCALPMHLKRMLLTSRCALVRRMRRWFYAALVSKCYMHDRPSGDPVTIPPVYGDDSSASEASEEEVEEREAEEKLSSGTASVRLLTWNTKFEAELPFVVEASKQADILCLQEVTSVSTAWLREALGETFDLLTAENCGGSWDCEGLGVAIAVRKKRFEVHAPKQLALHSEMQRSLLTVRVQVPSSRLALLVATAHLESGAEAAEIRQKQLEAVGQALSDDSVDAAVFAADCNLALQEEVPAAAGLGEDAWALAGRPEDKRWTWPVGGEKGAPRQRFDRIFVQARRAVARAGTADPQTLELREGTFALGESSKSDHRSVQCSLTLRESRQKQRRRRAQEMGEPLRAGARPRVGGKGVARRPAKTESCAKVEPHTEKNAGGPTYYCGKHHEKPRIRTGDAAIVEDPRRKGLWRLSLPRNCAHVNSHLAAVAIVLCANSDCQPVLTAKGVADYVCKYITKYGAGMSVTSRVASLLDDIISRVPEGKTMTVASLLAKAFIATAVPDCLCCLEAWHILWGLPRTVASRFFKGLNMDGLTGVKEPKKVPKEGTKQAEEQGTKLSKRTVIQLYADRADLPCEDEELKAALPGYCLLRFSAELDFDQKKGFKKTGAGGRFRPRVMNLKPYLQLDVSAPTAAKHAKMALRMLRPWQGTGDPMELDDEAALGQLEQFAADHNTPRWFRKRYQYHNRERRRAPAKNTSGAAADASTTASASAGARASASAKASVAEKIHAVQRHGLHWEKVEGDKDRWTVKEALQHSRTKPSPACLKEMLQALGAVEGSLPRARPALVEALVLHLLWVDVQPYSKAGSGITRTCLSRGQLWVAAQAWIDFHKSSACEKDRKALQACTAYAELWNTYKRLVLQECGLHVLVAPAKRFYFDKPHDRPKGPHLEQKTGAWRQPVTAPLPYMPAPEDAEDAQDGARARAYVRNATHEQSMGAGAVPELEVPLPEDDDALECPDKATKAEWDALCMAEDFVKREGFGKLEELQVPDTKEAKASERLGWVKPEREGGCTAEVYAEALRKFPNPLKAEVPVPLESLDPTQRAFADLVLSWATEAQRKRRQPEFCAVLLGTAGTGKTTTLQAVLERLRQTGFGKVLVAAYTGVASSNVGGGARTLHDLFQLSKVNAASGELKALDGEDLEKLAKDLAGLRLLVIDEVSMVSRPMLADVDKRLQEWRTFTKHPAKKEPFGGVGVILAGDFGQLPPTKAEHLSLLCPHDLKGQAALGKRLFARFKTVVRLRRIHRQAGASHYKESLIRLRDGAMTKEDWQLWLTHDLADDGCKLTRKQRQHFEQGPLTHLFAENAGAGERNGLMTSQEISSQLRCQRILRVASRDNSCAASRQPCDNYGGLRRVVHLVEGAPAMIISNLRTPAGLVNGATGTVVGVVLRSNAEDRDIRGAVSAADVAYVVLDVPKYCGPVVYPGHPTWVPIEPTVVRHKRFKGWERRQLPLVLAWGITIHKSQGLTFDEGAVVDFAHHPSYQPVANVGLAFVAMSRTRDWDRQAFRNLPDFWEFRKVLKDKLFAWRRQLEERMDQLHDETMSIIWDGPFSLEEDVRRHREWTEQNEEKPMTPEALKDLEEMLGVRGLREAPVYDDEPQEDRSGPKGGGGRSGLRGMKAPRPKKRGRSEGAGTKRQAPEAHEEDSPKRVRQEESDPHASEYDMFAEFDEALHADAGGFDGPLDFGGFDDPLGFGGLDDPDGLGGGAGFDDPDAFGFCGFDDPDADEGNMPKAWDGEDGGGDAGGDVGQLEEATGARASLQEEMQGEAEVPLGHSWGDRFFEQQKDSECGRHALNNVLGRKVFTHDDLRRTAKEVVELTQEQQSEHVKPGGWYSHSVLARALLDTTDSQLMFSRLQKSAYHTLMLDETAAGAVVNQDNYHWIALVKHHGLLWEVDSRKAPALMDQQAFSATVERFPNTFAIVRKGHWEA